MATQLSVNPYQINSKDPIPLNKISKWGFPTATVATRGVTDGNGNNYILLSTGVYCYGQIIWPDAGITALVIETQAALATLAG